MIACAYPSGSHRERTGNHITKGLPLAGDKPLLGDDYDLERWSTGERDDDGHLIWHDRYPHNDEWNEIQIITINFIPDAPPGEGDYRNYEISPDRPLDPYGLDNGQSDWFDLDDVANQAFKKYQFEV